MKKNRKNAFTLIELLAVIVILAIIALIATPIVINIIEDSKKNSFIQTANGIIDSGEYYYAREILNGTRLKEVKAFTFPSGIEGLEFDGEIPKSGSMLINTKGEIAIALSNGKYCVTKDYNSDKTTVTEDIENCYNPGILTLSDLATTTDEVTSVDVCAQSGRCESGTKFAIKVNEEEIYNFYVIADNGEEVTLIMDRNIGDKVPWVSLKVLSETNGQSGPVTALEELEFETKEWTNIQKYTYILENDDDKQGGTATYPSMTRTDVRARMLTYTEAVNLGCTNSVSTSKCPSYLYENLSSENIVDKPYAYWLSTVFSQTTTPAWTIDYQKYLYLRYDPSATSTGVRPVIKIPAHGREKIPVETISISTEDSITIFKGDSVTVNTTVKPSNANNKKLKWSSSDESVATVENGAITSVGVGTATIIVTTTDGTSISKEINVAVTLPTNGIMSSENRCIIQGTCTDEDIIDGIKVNVQVNDTQNYDFYVISDTGSKLTMIMDRNLDVEIEWDLSSTNTYGPITALTELNAQTDDWDNIEAITSYTYINNKNGTTNTYGYQQFIITDGNAQLIDKDYTKLNLISGIARARLLTYEEAISDKIGCTEMGNSCRNWLYDNLYTSQNTLLHDGYWTLTAHPTASWAARTIYCHGGIANTNMTMGTSFGLRPVITISK